MTRAATRVLAEGLGHPEGPDVLPDGRVVFVETYTGSVLSWDPGRGLATIATCGGGTNACVAGDDGWIYVAQNGGHVGGWRADDPVTPSIQRVRTDGTVEFVTTLVDGAPLRAPNDLAFGPDGVLYFTDSGRFEPENRPDPGRICALGRDGAATVLVETGPTYPNGIVVEADGGLVWVESFDRLVRRRSPDGRVTTVAELADGHTPDGLAIDAEGRLWITVTAAGGLDVLAADGQYEMFVATGGVPLNCTFAPGGGLYITDFGTFDTSGPALMVGALTFVDVPVRGRRVFRGSITVDAPEVRG